MSQARLTPFLLTVIAITLLMNAVAAKQKSIARADDSAAEWSFQAKDDRHSTSPKPTRTAHRRRRHRGHMAALLESKCSDPSDLSEQFMNWVQQSQADPTALAMAVNEASEGSDEALRLNDPEVCADDPAEASSGELMDRALCPWQWQINRDDHRQPKLISEARCLCSFARGSSGAQCLPIKRDFPVLKRVYCDKHQMRFEYVRAFQTITVGCHSVMPKTQHMRPLSHHLRRIFNPKH